MHTSAILLIITTTFVSKRVPMNFDGTKKKSYSRFPMISGNGTEKLFTTRFESQGLIPLIVVNHIFKNKLNN